MPKRLLLAAALLLALVCLAWPIYVIRPFRPQSPAELDSALFLLRFRPYLFAAALLAAISTRPKTRPTQLALATILLAALLSRINIFELMFHPIDAPAFLPSAQSPLDPDDKLLAINVNGAARAYPVRALAYHHIVNDTLAGVPLVGTY